jgi:Zn-dependent peptidase ImmA (M78 family)
MKPDDSSLDPGARKDVREQADRLLREAGAYGRFPTPIDDLISAARLKLDREASLDEGFLKKIYRSAGTTIRRAVGKVLGLFDSRARAIYIDQTVHERKRPFLLLHETGHGYMKWQRDLYAFMEDGESELDPDVREEFERQANFFASTVLFQCETFLMQARDMPLSLDTPKRLSKQYGASLYSSIRQFVSTNNKNCVVLVLEKPVWKPGDGYVFELRRVVCSPAFTKQYGNIRWQQYYSPKNFSPDALPLVYGNPCKILSPRIVRLNILGSGHEENFVAEAYNFSNQVFLLLYPESELSSPNTLA